MDSPKEQKKSDIKSVFDRIGNVIAPGYGNMEDLRALDKALRDQYNLELMNLRHQWEKIYLGVLEAGQSVIGRECKYVIQTIDRLAATINRADYGYAPLFDRVENIQGEALKSVLDYDRGLAVDLIKLGESSGKAEAAMKSATWSILASLVDGFNNDLRIFEEKWGKRKQMIVDDVQRG